MIDTFRRVHIEGKSAVVSDGPKGTTRGVGIFFSGVGPRVMWISIGGFIFFGAYEQAVRILNPLLTER